MESSVPQLLPLLKQYFGFTSFRPLQEEIIRDALAGKDVFALLPTGGGKSLCFQLPAMARAGLTVVVSPLIALMKDQVDGLQASGRRLEDGWGTQGRYSQDRDGGFPASRRH